REPSHPSSLSSPRERSRGSSWPIGQIPSYIPSSSYGTLMALTPFGYELSASIQVHVSPVLHGLSRRNVTFHGGTCPVQGVAPCLLRSDDHRSDGVRGRPASAVPRVEGVGSAGAVKRNTVGLWQ